MPNYHEFTFNPDKNIAKINKMQSKNVLFLASVLLFASCAHTQNLNSLMDMMNKNEGLLNPKEFNMVLIMKGIKEVMNVEGHDVAVLKDENVHQSDVIATALAKHKESGGTYKHAYISTHDEHVKKVNAPLVLEMREAKGTAKVRLWSWGIEIRALKGSIWVILC